MLLFIIRLQVFALARSQKDGAEKVTQCQITSFIVSPFLIFNVIL